MSGVEPFNFWMGMPLIVALYVWLRRKHTYKRHNNHVEAGDPERSNNVLVMDLTVCQRRSAGFCCCWCGSLCQLAMKRECRRSWTHLLVSTCARSLTNFSIAPLLRMLSSSVLTNCFSCFMPYASVTKVVVPTKI